MSPSEPELVLLTVQAEPGTEIFVIDHRFELLAKGVGQLGARVEPGLYQVKLRAGRLIQELQQVVRPGSGEIVVRPPAMPFSSAAPLAGTSRTSEAHERAAEALSRTVHHRAGQGSQLFVFARRHEPDPLPTAGSPGRGLSLHDPDGTLLLDLDRAGEADRESPDPWVGATLDVDPGTYRLRVATPRWGALERTVVASPGWQTQVFLLQSDYGDEGVPELRPDLASAATLMTREGGFVSSLEGARRVELARGALVRGRSVVAAEQLLAEAADNPMLGILGAHALLLAQEPDLGAVRAVVESLASRVGAHPDVDALRLALGDDVAQLGLAFPQPPMLMTSWGQVVDASWADPGIVPDGSLSARVATWFWGYGPWLVWRADGVEDQPEELPTASLDDALAHVAGVARHVDPTIDLTDAEEALLAHVTRTGAGPPPSFDVAPRGEADTPPAPSPDAGLARALGLPPAAVKTVATSLADKLAR